MVSPRPQRNSKVSFTEFYEMVTGGNSPPPGLGGVGGVAAAGAGAGGGTALATTAPLGQNVVQQRNKKKQVGEITPPTPWPSGRDRAKETFSVVRPSCAASVTFQ